MSSMDQYGLPMMAAELVLLAIGTVAAVSTDESWERSTRGTAGSKPNDAETGSLQDGSELPQGRVV